MHPQYYLYAPPENILAKAIHLSSLMLLNLILSFLLIATKKLTLPGSLQDLRLIPFYPFLLK